MSNSSGRPRYATRRGERPRNHHLIRCGTVGGCLRAPAYRVGEEYHWQTHDPRAERVTVGVDPECRFGRDAAGEVLVYRGRCPAWFPLTSAMLLGWCWVVERDNSGYRQLEGYMVGEEFSAVPDGELAEPVRLWLGDGTRGVPDEEGRYLFFRGEWGIGFPLPLAVENGWCSPRAPSGGGSLRPLDWNPLPRLSAVRQQEPAA